MNYAIELLKSNRFILQQALSDIDKTNHFKVLKASLEKKIESIDMLLKLAKQDVE